MDKCLNIKTEVNIEKEIKSNYILKGVFSFLSVKQILNMIIYNKHLQKICGVDIEYLKKISGKYKIGDKNGIGKEYKLGTNELIFEGQYLKGKRNGKGKEYNENSVLKFVGEYLNGKKWNRKGYGKDNNVKYELNGGNGIIKENDNSYEYLKGEINGKVRYYNSEKFLFEEEYLNGKKH